jgi:hypothetical protein
MNTPSIKTESLPPQFAVSKLYDYDATPNLIYEGWAKSGSLPSSPVWAIKKYVYVGANLTQELWANVIEGRVTNNNIWDNRVNLIYA